MNGLAKVRGGLVRGQRDRGQTEARTIVSATLFRVTPGFGYSVQHASIAAPSD